MMRPNRGGLRFLFGTLTAAVLMSLLMGFYFLNKFESRITSELLFWSALSMFSAALSLSPVFGVWAMGYEWKKNRMRSVMRVSAMLCMALIVWSHFVQPRINLELTLRTWLASQKPQSPLEKMGQGDVYTSLPGYAIQCAETDPLSGKMKKIRIWETEGKSPGSGRQLRAEAGSILLNEDHTFARIELIKGEIRSPISKRAAEAIGTDPAVLMTFDTLRFSIKLTDQANLSEERKRFAQSRRFLNLPGLLAERRRLGAKIDSLGRINTDTMPENQRLAFRRQIEYHTTHLQDQISRHDLHLHSRFARPLQLPGMALAGLGILALLARAFGGANRIAERVAGFFSALFYTIIAGSLVQGWFEASGDGREWFHPWVGAGISLAVGWALWALANQSGGKDQTESE